MIFKPKSRGQTDNLFFPCFTINGCKLNFASQFKYLGHIISDTTNDDNDLKRD